MGIHTEDEAKTKWCPLSRTYDVGRGISGYNSAEPDFMRDGDLRRSTRCQGSECMLWQWQADEWEYSYAKDSPKGDGWEREEVSSGWRWRRPRVPRGFCGVARSV